MRLHFVLIGSKDKGTSFEGRQLFIRSIIEAQDMNVHHFSPSFGRGNYGFNINCNAILLITGYSLFKA
jgi:hypothetical protein